MVLYPEGKILSRAGVKFFDESNTVYMTLSPQQLLILGGLDTSREHCLSNADLHSLVWGLPKARHDRLSAITNSQRSSLARALRRLAALHLVHLLPYKGEHDIRLSLSEDGFDTVAELKEWRADILTKNAFFRRELGLETLTDGATPPIG